MNQHVKIHLLEEMDDTDIDMDIDIDDHLENHQVQMIVVNQSICHV
jgi:hypothetical protein